MRDKNTQNSTSTINDFISVQARLKRLGITLTVIGSGGILLLLLSLVNYAINQAQVYTKVKVGVVIYYFISTIVLSLMLSGGIYMYKTSKVISKGLKNKIKKEVNNDKKD